MSTNRMEAFSDGVLAIVITIMVLKLKTPESLDIEGLREILPTILTYILSYAYIAIYWVNHHHLLGVLHISSGKVLWKNLFWLFWMSLIPTASEWMGLHPFVKFPAFIYGVTLFMCSVSYNFLQAEVIKIKGKDSLIARQIGKDYKGKGSIIAYVIAVIFSLFIPLISYIIYLLIALIWTIPDKRLESRGEYNKSE